MKSMPFVLAAACATLVPVFFQSLSPAEVPVDFSQITLSFDREACEADCRARYGVDWYELHRRGGGGDRGLYYLYARCIQECNDRFWKEFDKEHP